MDNKPVVQEVKKVAEPNFDFADLFVEPDEVGLIQKAMPYVNFGLVCIVIIILLFK